MALTVLYVPYSLDGDDRRSGGRLFRRCPSFGLTDYSQIDTRGVRYRFVNFGAGTSLDAPIW
jgi:hypothetical protein